MATSKILRNLTATNSLVVYAQKNVNNSTTISLLLPDTGPYPILFLYEGGDYNSTPIYGAIGIARWIANASQWKNAAFIAKTHERISSADVSDTGLLTITLTQSTSYNSLKILTL